MTVKFELTDGRIVDAKKDCTCPFHDGPHWLYADRLWHDRNLMFLNKPNPTWMTCQAFAQEEEMRLRNKLQEMQNQRIFRIIQDET